MINWDSIVKVYYNKEEPIMWHNQEGMNKIKFIETNFPNTLKFLSQKQLKTLSNQHDHFAEIRAMSYFIDEGYDAYYIESGFITSKNTGIINLVQVA